MAALKLVTAILSVTVAGMLWPLLPRVLALPSPDEVSRLNAELRRAWPSRSAPSRSCGRTRRGCGLPRRLGQIGAWEWSLDTADAYWSDTQSRLFGSPPSAQRVTRETWLARVHPDDRADVDALLAAASDPQRGDGYAAEFRVLGDGGSIRWLAERGRRMEATAERPARLVGVTVDVTERRRIHGGLARANEALELRVTEDEQALLVISEQQRAVFDNSPDGMFVVRVTQAPDRDEPEFSFELFNQAFERVTAASPDTLLLRQPHECLLPEHAREVVEHYRECVESGGSVTFRSERPGEGGPRTFETSLAPVRDPRTGRAGRLVGATRDITERLRLEMQVLRLQRIEVTGRLTAGVAYDFNNLLQAMIGGLEMPLLEVDDHARARGYADVAFCRRRVVAPS